MVAFALPSHLLPKFALPIHDSDKGAENIICFVGGAPHFPPEAYAFSLELTLYVADEYFLGKRHAFPMGKHTSLTKCRKYW